MQKARVSFKEKTILNDRLVIEKKYYLGILGMMKTFILHFMTTLMSLSIAVNTGL